MRTALAVVLGAILLSTACGPAAPRDPVQAKARESGIEVLGVVLMADGDVARVNYRVVDYDTAKRALRLEVLLLREGAERPLPVMSTGRLGTLRQRPTRDGRPQFMLFTNPGRLLRRGDHAVLSIGGSRIAPLLVS